ncbi:MAG: NADH-quinone oxidoreductase subunit E [Alistipes sp.]|nr:NADH-quinone oxidoreductase subunit E [Alistipes sp.]MBR5132285.1 NADH-quinone oxidoreductase subunit E [Alistipes sp.]
MYLLTLLAAALAIALIFIVPKRAKVWVATALISVAAIGAIALSVETLLCGDIRLATFATSLFGKEHISVDGISALFLSIIAIASVATVLYSRGYVGGYLERYSSTHISLHYTALVMLVVSMMLVVVTSGGFSFLFSWELMTIASFILILFEAERQEVRRAALNYLVMMHIGFMFLVAGFVMLYNVTDSANFAAVECYFKVAAPLPLFMMLFIGFGMKAGLFPMHIWLPEAHPAAPSHVSAIMSGVMIKTGVYGILRLMQAIDNNIDLLYNIGLIVLLAGIVTGIWGVIFAAMQNDVKRLLAYSSIENIGVILIGLGVAAVGHAAGSNLIGMCGMCGALLHIVNHSLFKTMLFFSAGNVYSKMHTTAMNQMGGLAKHMPVTAILMLFATVAICALPPLNGFVSELLIYIGMFNGVSDGHEVLYAVGGIIALSLIGGVVVLAFTKLYGIVFLGSPRSHHVAECTEVDNQRIAAMAIPAALILFVGLLPQLAIRPIALVAEAVTGADSSIAVTQFTPMLTSLSYVGIILILVIALLFVMKYRAQQKRKIESGPTWGCGFTAPNTRMQYTGESFSEGLENVGRPLMKDMVDGRSVDKGEIFPSEHNYKVVHKDKVDSLLGQLWVKMMHNINGFVMRLRTGRVNNYITFALAFLFVVLILTMFGVL